MALAREGAIQGRVLDVGCGTGEHARMVAAAGLDVTGIDLASAAIAVAKEKARARGLAAQFLVLSALQLASLGGNFDTVLDCGLFHVLGDNDRHSFVDNLKTVIRPGGQYFMLCFSDRQPGKRGPRRIRSEEITTGLGEGWRVDSIEPAKFEIWIVPKEAQAWLACVTRA